MTEPDDEFEDHLGADVSPGLKSDVRIAAAKEGVSMAEFVRRALRNELARVENSDE